MPSPLVAPRSRAAVGLVGLLLLSACIGRYVRIQEKGLTCGEAYHFAIEAVRRMNYTVTEATKPVPTSPGMIIATREDGTRKRSILVSVACTTQGTEIEAKGDQGGVTELNFPSEFRRSFAAAVANQAPPRAAAEQGLDVLVAPTRDGGQAGLGVDLGAINVLPVSVRITNHTARTYSFNAKKVVMRTAGGERVKPLTLEQLVKRTDTSTSGVPSGAADRTVAAVQGKLLTQATVAPNETLSGFLLFPFDSYTRARVELIDQASDEAEGFAIDF